MERVIGAGRCAAILAVTTVCLAVLTAPAAAQWAGTMERELSQPGSSELVLALHNSSSSFGLHFGLSQPGFTVSNVEANAPGPFNQPASR